MPRTKSLRVWKRLKPQRCAGANRPTCKSAESSRARPRREKTEPAGDAESSVRSKHPADLRYSSHVRAGCSSGDGTD